jgi:hypothetical protein
LLSYSAEADASSAEGDGMTESGFITRPAHDFFGMEYRFTESNG